MEKYMIMSVKGKDSTAAQQTSVMPMVGQDGTEDAGGRKWRENLIIYFVNHYFWYCALTLHQSPLWLKFS